MAHRHLSGVSPKLAGMLRWPYTFAVVLSLSVGATAIYYSQTLGIALKDPEGFLGPAYIRLPMIALIIFAAGIVPQSLHRYGMKGFVPGMGTILRDEWNLRRVGHVATGMVAFYICYVSYRNLKSYLPELRKDESGFQTLYDTDMLRLDHWLFFGNNPAEVLHGMLGTTVMAQVLAVLYVLYLPIVPLTVGAVLVLVRDYTVGAWYATAVSLNWVLGTISYYLIPTLGPAFFQPQSYAELPDNGASALQQSLFRAAVRFRDDPQGGGIYGIAGFASLHVSVVFTAALFLHYSGAAKWIRTTAWVYVGFTLLATLYLGWHYVADDIGGLLIGWMAVAIGAVVTGNARWQKRRRMDPGTPQEMAESPPTMANPPAI